MRRNRTPRRLVDMIDAIIYKRKVRPAVPVKKEVISLEKLPRHSKSYLMNASYDSLVRNMQRTLEIFIIFEDGDTVIEVPAGKGHRSIAIDKIIDYFIEIEDYEKCAVLRDLKEQIIKNGD